MLEEDAVKHGEDDVLLRFGQAAHALELTLELGRGPALAGGSAAARPGRARDPEDHVDGHVEEGRELGHEGDGEAEPTHLTVSGIAYRRMLTLAYFALWSIDHP